MSKNALDVVRYKPREGLKMIGMDTTPDPGAPSNAPSYQRSHEHGDGGERREATVLFADLAGFTSFAERFGEEVAYALMRAANA